MNHDNPTTHEFLLDGVPARESTVCAACHKVYPKFCFAVTSDTTCPACASNCVYCQAEMKAVEFLQIHTGSSTIPIPPSEFNPANIRLRAHEEAKAVLENWVAALKGNGIEIKSVSGKPFWKSSASARECIEDLEQYVMDRVTELPGKPKHIRRIQRKPGITVKAVRRPSPSSSCRAVHAEESTGSQSSYSPGSQISNPGSQTSADVGGMLDQISKRIRSLEEQHATQRKELKSVAADLHDIKMKNENRESTP